MVLRFGPWLATSLCMLYFRNDLPVGIFVSVLLFLALYFWARRLRGVTPEPSDATPGRVMLLTVVLLFAMNALAQVPDLIQPFFFASTTSAATPDAPVFPVMPEPSSELSVSGWALFTTHPLAALRGLLLMTFVLGLVGAFLFLVSVLPGLFAWGVTKVYDICLAVDGQMVWDAHPGDLRNAACEVREENRHGF